MHTRMPYVIEAAEAVDSVGSVGSVGRVRRWPFQLLGSKYAYLRYA